MNEPTQAFPLQWPAGWRRAVSRERAKFGKKAATYYDTYENGQRVQKRGTVAHVLGCDPSCTNRTERKRHERSVIESCRRTDRSRKG